jgi:hypothetical protein
MDSHARGMDLFFLFCSDSPTGGCLFFLRFASHPTLLLYSLLVSVGHTSAVSSLSSAFPLLAFLPVQALVIW